jgi:asparagine synthase (glutamine-hydrolysing)
MCGIAGIFGHLASERTVGQMADLMAHRGPDDSGTWYSDGGEGAEGWGGGGHAVALGHRRLAILDPTPAGHQPMERGDLVLVYNGEIYNFPELQRRYASELRTHCDSEAILLLYRDHGARCVEHLEGMYAFVIWNRRTRSAFAARDPLGIKPLLFRPLPEGGLALASELKALAQRGAPADHPLAPPEIDLSSVRDVFTYKYVPTPKTIYRGIEKLPAGHSLEWSAEHGIRVKRFWSPRTDPTSADGPQSLEEAEEAFEPLFREVVRQHALSDVPLGVFLSGGIDSTAVTAALSEGATEAVSTFTLGFDVRSHDESAIARQVAQHLGTFHHERLAAGMDLHEALGRYPLLYDEPFGDHGAWAMHLVAGLARQHVKVALTGEGGDELFGGYQWYRKAPHQEAGPHHRLARFCLPALSSGSRAAQRRLATGLERYSMFLGPFSPLQRQKILHPELIDSTGGWRSPATQGDSYDDLWHFRRHWRDDLPPLKRMQWVDLNTYLVDDMLTKVDRATMAVSLEARPPFVDRRIVEFALSLPDHLLSDRQRGKLVLRRYLRRRVPEATFERPKIGFSMPVKRWAERSPELLSGALHRLHRRGILASPRIRPHNNEQVWTLLVLDRWFET